MNYVKMGGKLYDMPDEFIQARKSAEEMNKLGNDLIDALCLLAALFLFAAFVYGTLSLG